MAYRQTNKQVPTEEQIANLLEYNKTAIWNPEFLTKQVFAYTWYDPKLIFNSWEDFKDVVINSSHGTQCGKDTNDVFYRGVYWAIIE